MRCFQIFSLAICVIAGSSAAFAQDAEFSIQPKVIEACLIGKEANEGMACVGLAAGACMEATDDGSTTVGMSSCIYTEQEWWDKRLNTAYQKLLEIEARDDKENEQYGYAPKKLPVLKQMARAWIPYRDALCDYERVQWGAGTGGGPAYGSCILQETARQYFVYERRQVNEAN